jgi:gluconolactonase
MKKTLRTIVLLLTASAPVAAQDFSQVKVEEVATGFKGGEGSVWSREGFLIFSDYSQDRLYKYVPGKPPEVYREQSNGANGNTMDRQGRLYSCEYKARRVTRTDRKGRIEVLVDRFEEKRFNAPNDRPMERFFMSVTPMTEMSARTISAAVDRHPTSES